MSVDLTDRDLESRLRDMYAAVAAATVVDDPVLETVPAARPEPPARRRVALLVAAAVIVIAAVGFLVSRRGDAQPAGPMDNRPFAIPMWMPSNMGLDGTALLAVNDVGPAFSPPTRALTATMKYTGPNDRIVFINSFDAKGVSAIPAGSTVVLPDGTVAQWDDRSLPHLAWTLPTGQGVSVTSAGPEVTKDELVQIASSLWYVDRATWNAVTAKSGYTSRDFQKWRIPGERAGVELLVTGSMRGSDPFRHLSLRTGSTGTDYQPPRRDCSVWSPFDGPSNEDVLVFQVTADAIAVQVTGPNGETVEAPVVMAPGLPMYRWVAIAFPDAPAQWVTGTDHSSSCTAVFP